MYHHRRATVRDSLHNWSEQNFQQSYLTISYGVREGLRINRRATVLDSLLGPKAKTYLTLLVRLFSVQLTNLFFVLSVGQPTQHNAKRQHIFLEFRKFLRLISIFLFSFIHMYPRVRIPSAKNSPAKCPADFSESVKGTHTSQKKTDSKMAGGTAWARL